MLWDSLFWPLWFSKHLLGPTVWDWYVTKMLYLFKVDNDTINWSYVQQRTQRFFCQEPFFKSQERSSRFAFQSLFHNDFFLFLTWKVAYLIRHIVSELKVLIEGLGGFTVWLVTWHQKINLTCDFVATYSQTYLGDLDHQRTRCFRK